MPTVETPGRGRAGRILVIGNGASVRNARLGDEIDAFPSVGRINNYETVGFEPNAGHKTDIWFNGANQGLKKRSDVPSRVVVLVPPEVLAKKGESIRPRIRRRLGLEQGAYELVALEEVRSFAEMCGVHRPTTGTMALLWALERFQEVWFHGFDFFIDSKSHYNDSRIRRWWVETGIVRQAVKHDMHREREFIDGLVRAGRLHRLHSYPG